MALSEAELVACYERVQHRLYNVLYRLLWQAQDCQDVMHEAFLQVWRRRGGVGAESLEGLVFTTALNLARNQLRWQSLRAFVGLDQAPPAPGAGGDESPALRRALQRLPPGHRQVLLLSEIGGFSTREIAGMLGIPEGTVGSRKHAALAQLRNHLEKIP